MLDEPKRSARPRSDDDNTLELALLERIKRGDREALRQLYGRYYHALLRFIYRMTGQLELAKEGVNDVMLVVWRNGESFGGRSLVRTWIMGIAYRKALKLLERSKRWSDRIEPDHGLWDDREPSAHAVEPTSSLDLEDLLARGLQELSPKHRAVVELTYFYGYSYEEIAAIADCPVNTVKTRMFHARARLKELLPQLAKDEP
ncbi:MAG TPA: sigma-70 family RNA polymerase sigma factor [Gammaproteobacteria bacterium]